MCTQKITHIPRSTKLLSKFIIIKFQTMSEGRRTPNYKSRILLEVIRGVEPASKIGWERVAIEYKERSQEAVLRDYQDIKRYFIQKMCNSNKKITGESNAKKSVEDSQRVYNRILAKEGAGDYGDEDDDDDEEETVASVVNEEEEAAESPGNDYTSSLNLIRENLIMERI